MLTDPEINLVIAYGPAGARPALKALWRLDATLSGILRTTTDPNIGQMRFTWWYDAVGATAAIRGEPVLEALSVAGVEPQMTRPIVEGWESLLDGSDDAALTAFAAGRGGGLFRAAAEALGAEDPIDDAGAAWALVDLARHHSQPDVRRRALLLAALRSSSAPPRWSKPARPLAMLAKLVRRDLSGLERQGSPRRIAALAALALTGR